MRPFWVLLFAFAALNSRPLLLAQSPAAPGSLPSAATAPDGCKTHLALEPLDQSVLRLLGSGVAPANQSGFANASFRQLREWDFPSRVTPWSERPSAEELARRREELTNQPTSKAGKASLPPGISRPYDLQPLPPRDWDDLEKWFAKEAPKRVSGACVDHEKASYILAIGIISAGDSAGSMMTASRRNDYGQTLSARQQDASVGPNAGTPQGPAADSHELNSMGGEGSSRAGSFTCTYVYRTSGVTRRETPEYYYCRSGGTMPRSAVTAMLKYLAGANLQ